SASDPDGSHGKCLLPFESFMPKNGTFEHELTAEIIISGIRRTGRMSLLPILIRPRGDNA
ncbi:MAG TPA: hypothetical protein PKK43_17755, partial [Spirochaetota bacterium]|nr:hypothetical protein [Spirochaetota bacterium]